MNISLVTTEWKHTHTHTHRMDKQGKRGNAEKERDWRKGDEERRREMYKLSTLSRKMALKLSRACVSTRDSGKLPFIASQTMGRLTVLRTITHTHIQAHTSDSAMPDNSASRYLHYSSAAEPLSPPSLPLSSSATFTVLGSHTLSCG